jgi:hypothetical protein
MVLGMSLQTYTAVHVIISLIGIVSGLVVVAGLLANKRLDSWTAIFLTTTVLTSVTGFLFPFKQMTPGIVLGVLSLIALTVAIVARYRRHLIGGWRRTYVITAIVSLYFNVFVLVVQSFEKVPALHVLAPTQKEAPFGITQLVVLIAFVVVGVMAVKRFRASPVAVATGRVAA